MNKLTSHSFPTLFQLLGSVVLSIVLLGSVAPVFFNPAQADPASVTQTDNEKKATATPAPAVSVDKIILNSPVVDEANLLSASEKQQLSDKLKSIYQQGLAQAGLVIVPSTNGTDIFDYSMQLAEKWQLGNKDTDNGLLIVVAVNDHKMYILTGYGLEGTLPDGAVGRIIRNDITPYFKQDDYAQGLMVGINRLEERLTADPATLLQADKLAEEQEELLTEEERSGSPILFFILCILFGDAVTGFLGRVLGSWLVSIVFFILSVSVSGTFFLPLVLAIVLWYLLVKEVFAGSSSGGGSSGGFGGGSSGGFGGGGFSGGGGSFGGGGAGGSW
ncbi:MAG: methanol dehydrogenase [Gammaproteobacteria bacterium]|nr:MAG: methanol dehydrogenase [Gammaproteobacteria bacterium]